MAILGANGAGKSTLLRIMANLAAPSGGRRELAPKKRVAYIGHATFLYPNLDAFENLRFQARINSLPADAASIMAWLGKVRLDKFAHEACRHFSRGMAQRLNFARALMLEPDIFLLDEPFTGLDQESAQLMKAELQARRHAGCAIALVSHAPEADLATATHVGRLAGGRFALTATGSQGGGGERPC